MRIAVPKERAPGERRVALVPDTIKRLVARHEVIVEAGAGLGAYVSDQEYFAAGAKIEPSTEALFAGADAVLKVQPPTLAEVTWLREGAALVSLLYPFRNPALVRALSARKASVFALDLVPRTTLAQMMDVLSSQATIAGYRAVMLAAHAMPRLAPMLMTAAGTIAPARFLVLGAGVAGLQAIAVARRMGAVVEAFDVRKVVKEQVESLGAQFIAVDSSEDAQTAGGYAREVSAEYQRKQAALIAERVAACDVCITTALIPGQKAPVLVTAEMVRAMRPGSIVVDVAAEAGGNCELTRPGETVDVGGVTVIGELNLASAVAVHASQMLSRNLEKLLVHVTADGQLKLDATDEITRGCLVVRKGEVVHGAVADRLQSGG